MACAAHKPLGTAGLKQHRAEIRHIVHQRIGLPFVFWYCYQLHAGKADISFRRRKAREAYLIGHEKGLIDDYGDPVNPTASARAQAACASEWSSCWRRQHMERIMCGSRSELMKFWK